MMASGFTAAVSEWTREAEGRIERVFKTAAQDLYEEMSRSVHRGGRLPFKTGNLQRSILASTTAMPTIMKGKAEFRGGEGEVTLVIAGSSLGDTIYFGVQAEYGPRMEYGFTGTDSAGRSYNQPGFAFVRTAAQNWQSIVRSAEARVRGAASS